MLGKNSQYSINRKRNYGGQFIFVLVSTNIREESLDLYLITQSLG